jgi:alpha-1,3-glucosyltransferase
LFPFGRGLCHAYWAPNFWALYNIADKIAIYGNILVLLHSELLVFKTVGIPISNFQVASMTGGLVGETAVTHLVLPSIKPPYTMIMVVISIIVRQLLDERLLLKPMMVRLWKVPSKKMFLVSVVYSAMSFYMFGWHVHEKAILTAIIPLWLLATEGTDLAQIALFLSTVGHYSLFPLLFELQGMEDFY